MLMVCGRRGLLVRMLMVRGRRGLLLRMLMICGQFTLERIWGDLSV
jgi:hypothetical protein